MKIRCTQQRPIIEDSGRPPVRVVSLRRLESLATPSQQNGWPTANGSLYIDVGILKPLCFFCVFGDWALFSQVLLLEKKHRMHMCFSPHV